MKRISARKLYASMTALTAGFCMIGNAAAQSTINDNPIDYCRANSDTDAERIACLEGALSSLIGISTAQIPTEETLEPDAAPAPDTPQAPVAVAQTPAAPVTEPAQPSIELAQGLGAEQVNARAEREDDNRKEIRKERQKKQSIEATLVDFAKTGSGKLILVLSNGQVWAQRSGDRTEVRLRKGDKPSVVVRKGSFSGYRMEISKPNRTIIVERLR